VVCFARDIPVQLVSLSPADLFAQELARLSLLPERTPGNVETLSVLLLLYEYLKTRLEARSSVGNTKDPREN
jgi:hypothetical protein